MSSAHILIIEDDAYEAEHLKLHLQQAGHRVSRIVTSGEQAVRQVAQNGYDLMVVDIVLSGEMDGIEAVQRIREIHDIPAIFLTAHVSDELLLRAERARPFAYLLKPYRQRELEFMINVSLARSQIEKELEQEKQAAESRLHQALAIIQHTNDGIILTDPQEEIVSVNPAFTRITGYREEEAVGRNSDLLESGRHAPAFFSDIKRSIDTLGHWQGEIWKRRKNGEVYPEWLTINPIYDADGSLTHYVRIFSDITRVKQSEAELHHLAHHDTLTDLPNRLLLMTRLRYTLRTACRHKFNVALLFLDLDGFKLINDSLGHEVGDNVLQVVARRLKHKVREADMVARIGGDEFVMLLESIDDPIDASLVAEKLTQILQEPVVSSGHKFTLNCSIGIATYPKDGNTVEDLLRNADAAMTQAKKASGNHIVFYNEEMTRKAYQRIQLYSALRQALENEEFELYFQPQFKMETGELCGAEALVRWRRPKMGLIGPLDFIHEAEESGMIVSIGDWVLQESCHRMQAWLDEGYKIGRIAVNLAGPQIQRGGLLTKVRRALEQSGLAPEYLELELTETYVMELMDSDVDTLRELQAMGVTIAIDDFGTGVSSMSRLKQLDINKLKIDRSFVMDLPQDKNDEAIVRAIISMGDSLGLQVIAEGVETDAQQQFLLHSGCLLGQGFLYSRPKNLQEFATFLKTKSLLT